jgi:hypothetical protein
MSQVIKIITESPKRVKTKKKPEKKAETPKLPKEPDIYNQTKKELQELESKKMKLVEGQKNLKGLAKIRGFLQRGAINLEINQRKGLIKEKNQLERLKFQNKIGYEKVELEKKSMELNELKKKNRLNLDPFTSAPSKLKFDELF